MTLKSHLTGLALALLSPAAAMAQGTTLPDPLVVLDRHPTANTVRPPSEPPITKCGLRLRHDATGTEFQLRKSEEVLVEGQTARYRSTGYYVVSRPGTFAIGDDEVLKVDCETHKATAVVRAGA